MSIFAPRALRAYTPAGTAIVGVGAENIETLKLPIDRTAVGCITGAVAFAAVFVGRVFPLLVCLYIDADRYLQKASIPGILDTTL